MCVSRFNLRHPTGLALPVGFLDVIIRFMGKTVAAFLAPSFQYISAAAGFHPRAKTVFSRPAPLFWLVSSFRHWFTSNV
jgi:hypothetical protein